MYTAERNSVTEFPPHQRQAFTRADIEAIPEGTIGCYALYRDQACVFVGKGDIRARLLSHLDGDNYCITMHRPSDWLHIVTTDVDSVERWLLSELAPRCNPRLT